jgi:hypothetical protein
VFFDAIILRNIIPCDKLMKSFGMRYSTSYTDPGFKMRENLLTSSSILVTWVVGRLLYFANRWNEHNMTMDQSNHVKSVHNNTKDHSCHQCDYSSLTKGVLKRHGDVEHKCALCDYMTAGKGHSVTHLTSVHVN